MMKVDELRKKANMMRMRKYRASLSAEKKDVVRLYDRTRRRDERYEKRTPSRSSPNYHQVLYRSKQIKHLLGDDPLLHALVLSKLLKESLNSPSKRKNIAQSCREFKHCFESGLEINDKSVDLETSVQDLNSKLRKIAVYRSAGKHEKARQMVDIINSKSKDITAVASDSGNKYSQVYRLMKTPPKRVQDEYKRKFSDGQKQEAINIYLDEEVSYSLPDEKYSHLRFMSCTIAEAYKNHYLTKSVSERKMGQSTFASLKPLFIRSISETPIRGCKCEYCQNFGMLRDKLIAMGFKGIPKNHSSSIEITWCTFRKNDQDSNEKHENTANKDVDIPDKEHKGDQLPQKNCVLRQCSECGIPKYRQELRAINSKLLRKKAVTDWTQWKIRSVFNGKKNVKRMLPETVTGTTEELFKDYLKKLKAISLHQFMKIWQLKQFNITLRNLRKGQILLVHDFSQNLLLFAQDEVPGAHWDHEQATIHPTVAYYIGPCGKVIKEEIIHITGDKKHDHYAVSVFVTKTVAYLRSKGVLVLEIIEWTDHCSRQYKSRKAFFVLSVRDMPSSRNFYGVKHGKGPSDRAGAHFKSFVKRIVKAKKAMLVTVEQLVNYSIKEYERQVSCNSSHDCVEKSKGDENHNLLKIIYTRWGEISRTDQFDQTITYKGTREIHSVRNTGINGIIQKRDMTCCCPYCLYGSGECLYPEYADMWTLVSVIGKRKLKSVKPSTVENWRNEKTSFIREIQNAVPNLVPTEKKRNKSTRPPVKRRLEMNCASKPNSTVQPSVTTVQPSVTPVTSTDFDWGTVAKNLDVASRKSYDHIVSVISENQIPTFVAQRKYKQTNFDPIWPTAMKFYPKDHPPNFVPIETIGDGNCFPRAVAHGLFGTQERHIEIRVRIVYEAVKNEQLYLNNNYLSLGVQNRLPARPGLRMPSTTIVNRYCLYSGDNQVHGLNLTRNEIQAVYRRDVLRISSSGGYMGIWQFHQTTQVGRLPIGTVYPDNHVNPTIRLDMNRMILPNNPAFSAKTPMYIMWSPLSEKSRASNVKHFVILLESIRYSQYNIYINFDYRCVFLLKFDMIRYENLIY